MSSSDIDLFHLPNEILLIILKKLDNIDVLYSLFGINSSRLDNLVQDDVFINTLNFATTTTSMIDLKLDRFCTSILPQSHHYIKKLILNTISVERILSAGDYPSLTVLEIFNFGERVVFRYFTDNSSCRKIFQNQITDLTLHNDDQYINRMPLDSYTKNVYAPIFALFNNLEHLTIVSSSMNECPPLSISHLPATTCYSSTITVLSITVNRFEDCLSLLDNQLKQLTTLIVEVHYLSHMSLIQDKVDELHNLKCFSLISYNETFEYDDLVVPLLLRMTHLEKLTLYLRIGRRSAFVDGTDLYNDVLLHIPKLRTFIFYISTDNVGPTSFPRKSNSDIQQTFTNIRFGRTNCIIDYSRGDYKGLCYVYSLPFTFTRLEKITIPFPTIELASVTHLSACDVIPMKHQFFMDISRAFPLLKHFSLQNGIRQTPCGNEWKSDENSSYPVIEYLHLTSLDLRQIHTDYLAQFLLETKTYLPRLTVLKVNYSKLRFVTMNFTREKTRRNCFNVKRIITNMPIGFLPDIYQYFPSLPMSMI